MTVDIEQEVLDYLKKKKQSVITLEIQTVSGG